MNLADILHNVGNLGPESYYVASQFHLKSMQCEWMDFDNLYQAKLFFETFAQDAKNFSEELNKLE